MSSYLLTLTKYNLWANERICKTILEAGELIADEAIKNSFPSIRKTVYHVWDAQVIWLRRLNGESLNTWPSHTFTGSLEEAMKLFLDNSEAYVRFVGNLQENDEQKVITYHAVDGTPYHSTIEEIILHAMNHSTFHRGQIVTMIRNTDFTKIPSTDLIRYFRERSK